MSAVKNIVVLISGNGSNLQAIIDAIAGGKLDAKVVAVISNNAGVYGLTRAKTNNIDAVTLDHRLYPSRESYDEALQQQIDTFSPDLVVLAGFMRILSEDFVTHYQGRMLNIHPSLLPKYKGLHTHRRAIEAGDKEHGASIHFVTPELDGGPVIIQSKVPVFTEDSEDVLASRVQMQERNIYPLVVSWFCSERLRMKNNKAYLDGNELPLFGYADE